MDLKPNLARDWWEAAIALIAAVFSLRAFFSLVAVLRPVPPTFEQDVIYLAVLAAGVSILAYLAAKRFDFAERLRPHLKQLLYGALASGTLLALWMAAAFPAHVAANRAYAADTVCGVVGMRDTASALCHTAGAHAVAAWYDRNANTYSLTLRTADGKTQNVELECPGARIFTDTVGTVRDVRIDYYGARISTVAVSGLLCATTFAPSPERTLGILTNALFGLAVASYAAWALWGERIAAWPARRRRERPSSQAESAGSTVNTL
jgi:hypothetical protein